MRGVDAHLLALYHGDMTTTATIRVPVTTRDVLAEAAKRHGLSLSGFLVDVAKREQRAAILAAARQEALDFENDPVAREEFHLWDDAPLELDDES